MKKQLVLCLLCSLFTNITAAQLKEPSFILKVSPVQFFLGDYTTKTIGIGLIGEKKLTNNKALQQEITFITTDNFTANSFLFITTKKTKGIQLRTDYKHYFSKNKQVLEGLYWSNDLNFTYTVANRNGRHQILKGVAYQVKRQVWASHLNIGWQEKNVNTPFIFEAVLGAGIRWVNANANIDANQLVGVSRDWYGKPYDETNYLGFSWRFDIRVGYAF